MTSVLPSVSLADLLALLADRPAAERERLKRAYEIAARAHHTQQRDEGSPFIEHPLRVARILAAELGRPEPDMLCAALLHDVVEDTSVSLAEIQERCGDTVALFVELLTKEKVADPEEKRLATRRYLQRIAAHSDEVLCLKLADRLDNLRSLRMIPDREKQRKYLLETYWLFLPIAQRGGPFFYEQYKQLMAEYLQQQGSELRLNIADFPEVTGGVETRRSPCGKGHAQPGI